MTNRIERLDQRAAEWGERVLDLGRDDRMHFARDQAVALEAAQSLSQHLLRIVAFRWRGRE
jgi:hypothetical protein